MSLEGKVAVVTGASRGIGKAISERLAKDGASIACIATRAENAAATAESIGSKARAYGCNVGDPDSVQQCFSQIAQELGPVAILVNNAGVTEDTLLMRMSEDQWSKPIDVNLSGAFRCSKAVLRDMMKARWGRIVSLSSVVGVHGGAGQANYAASKAGLIGFTKSLAKEVGSRGITCNAIAPGFIETDMTADLSEDMKQKSIDAAPIGRLGTPSDIAEAVAFLCSDGAGFITGQVLEIDGGLML